MFPVVPLALFAVAGRHRRIVRCFTRAGAVSPETARRVEELDLDFGRGATVWRVLRRMVYRGVLREAPGGRLWLDEGAHVASRRRRGVYVALAMGGAAPMHPLALLPRR